MELVHGGPEIEIVIPVYNEEIALASSVRKLAGYLRPEMRATWQITIADNASTDGTQAIGESLATILEGVTYMRLEEKGRGRALKQAWLASKAEVVAYLDVDLSTELSALPPLVAPLLSGHSDVAIGTRLDRTSRVVRGPKREFISRTYNAMLRGSLGVRFSDAQCGFKAMRAEVAQILLPHVEDTAWFFDTELLVLAERAGLRIHEVPVDWTDDPSSTVDLVQTAWDDVRGMLRMVTSLALQRIPLGEIYAQLGRRPLVGTRAPTLWGQVLKFASVGIASTVVYAMLYLMLQPVFGTQSANFGALLTTAILNTAANRRFTFGIRGLSRYTPHHVQGLIVFGVAWGLTSSSLLTLHGLIAAPGAAAELATLTSANVVATLLRFALLKDWVFRENKAARAWSRPGLLETRALDAA